MAKTTSVPASLRILVEEQTRADEFCARQQLLCKGLTKNSNSDENAESTIDDYEYDDDIFDNEDTLLPSVLTSNQDITPYFEKSEETYLVRPGDNILLNCDVRNFQIENVVMWFKNTTLIANGPTAISNRVEAFKNNSVQIKNVLAEDADNYHCEVLPQKVRFDVILKVGSALMVLLDGRDVTDRTVTLMQGESHTFECKTFFLTNAEIKWSFNGQRLHNAESNENKMVLLEDVDEQDIGTYQCLGDDGSPEPLHGMVTIDVHYRPTVSTHRHHVNTITGGNAELYCDYKANPIAINNWLKNGEIIQYSGKYAMQNSQHKAHNRTTLTVKDVKIDDLGTYVCRVKNSNGMNEVLINLGYEPETPQFEDMKVEGYKVTLHWLVRSLQSLSEAVLDYKLSGSYTWSTVSVIHTKRHADINSGLWKITHHMELAPGHWHARVKTKNTHGWSKFSPQHDFNIKMIDVVESFETPIDNIIDTPPDDLAMAGIGVKRQSNNSATALAIMPGLIVLTTTLLNF